MGGPPGLASTTMVPLGLLPVFVAALIECSKIYEHQEKHPSELEVESSLLQMKAAEALGPVVILQKAASDKQSSLHSSGRGRRELLCSKGEYAHPDGSHCCMKCHKGTHVAEHCSGQDKATKCSVCGQGEFMALENFREQCFGCGNCRPSFGQITLSNCTSDRDTICGCGKNQYQTSNTPEFFCRNCSSCQNGTIRQHCTRFNDTICECLPGYFLRTDENSCSPCSSCNNPACKRRCEALLPSVKNPSHSEQLLFILSSLVVLFGAGSVILLARKVAKQTCKKNQKPSSGLPSLDPEPTRELTSKVADCPLLVPPLGTKELLQNTTSVSLPDCVKSARERQIPNRPEVLYTVVDQVPISRWKEFIRYMGLKENVVERITMEQHFYREAQYEMLRHWRLQAGQDATVEHISNALKQMELNGCSEAIQEALAKEH